MRYGRSVDVADERLLCRQRTPLRDKALDAGYACAHLRTGLSASFLILTTFILNDCAVTKWARLPFTTPLPRRYWNCLPPNIPRRALLHRPRAAFPPRYLVIGAVRM